MSRVPISHQVPIPVHLDADYTLVNRDDHYHPELGRGRSTAQMPQLTPEDRNLLRTLDPDLAQRVEQVENDCHRQVLAEWLEADHWERQANAHKIEAAGVAQDLHEVRTDPDAVATAEEIAVAVHVCQRYSDLMRGVIALLPALGHQRHYFERRGELDEQIKALAKQVAERSGSAESQAS